MEEKIVAFTAIFLLIITISAVYIHQTNPQTEKNLELIQARQKSNAPPTAKYLGKHIYNISDQPIVVYTWKNQTTLYETQVSSDGSIKTDTYELKGREENCTISPYIAETIALLSLENMTQYYSGHEMLTGPEYDYYQNYFNKGQLWCITWGLQKDGYPIMAARFVVRVYAETGEIHSIDNRFQVGEIPSIESPKITEPEAIQIAEEAFMQSMEYPVIQGTESRGLKLSLGDEIMGLQPYQLYWIIHVYGIGIEDGHMVSTGTSYLIDAIDGTLKGGISAGSGVIWSLGNYPYYGVAYPTIHHLYPYDFTFPVNFSEARLLIFNHSLIGLPENLAWEGIYLEHEYNVSFVTSYWSRAYNGIKTGILVQPNGATRILESSEILDGYLMIINAETGELINAQNITNIGHPANTLNITREQAVSIVSGSNQTDPNGRIISVDNFVHAEPRIIKPDWVKQLRHVGSYERIYITRENITDPRIYWVVDYADPSGRGSSGTYLVDAETGKITLFIERGSIPTVPVSLTLPEKLTIPRNQPTSFNVTVIGRPAFDALLPAELSLEQLPDYVAINISPVSGLISNDVSVTFKVTLTPSLVAESGSYYVSVTVSVPDFRIGKGIDLVIE